MSPSTRKDLLALVLLPLAAAIFLADSLFTAKAFLPAHTRQFEPWRSHADPALLEDLDARDNRMMTDTIFMFLPQIQLTRHYLLSGRLPTWNPYVLAGVPHLEQNVPACFDPIVALAHAFDPVQALGWIAWIHLSLAGLFTLLLCRTIGLSRQASLLSAVVFAFSGWMTARLHYYQISGATLWLPALFLGLERLRRGGSRGFIALVAVALAGGFTAGMPQIGLLNLYAAAAYGLLVLSRQLLAHERAAAARFALRAGTAGVLGIALSSAQLLPSAALALSGETSRRPYTPEEQIASSLEPISLVTFLVPDLFGYPDWFRGLRSRQFANRSVLSIFYQHPSSNVVEIQAFVGLLPLALVLLSVFRWRGPSPRGFVMGMGLIGLLLATGTPLVRVVHPLPGLDVGDLKRFLLYVVFAASLLAGMELDRLTSGRAVAARRAMAAVAAGIVVLVIAGWLVIRFTRLPAFRSWITEEAARIYGVEQSEVATYLPDEDIQANASLIRENLGRFAVFYGLSAAALLGVSLGRSRRAAAWLVPVLVAADLFLFGAKFNRALPAEGMYENLPLFDGLRSSDGPVRILRYGPTDPPRMPIVPNLAMPLGIDDAQGYITLTPRRYEEVWNRLHPADPEAGPMATTVGVRNVTDPQILASPVLDMMNVGFIVSREAVESGHLEIAARDARSGMVVLRNPDVLPRVYFVPRCRTFDRSEELLEAMLDPSFDPRHEVLIEGDLPSGVEAGGSGGPARVDVVRRRADAVEVVVDAPVPGFLFRSVNFGRGWKVRIDGEVVPLLRANHAFQAVAVPAGRHGVRFSHEPAAVRAGLWMTAAALVALLGLLGLRVTS